MSFVVQWYSVFRHPVVQCLSSSSGTVPFVIQWYSVFRHPVVQCLSSSNSTVSFVIQWYSVFRHPIVQCLRHPMVQCRVGTGNTREECCFAYFKVVCISHLPRLFQEVLLHRFGHTCVSPLTFFALCPRGRGGNPVLMFQILLLCAVVSMHWHGHKTLHGPDCP